MTGARTIGSVTYYDDLIQGSDEWLAARCGLLTASEMKLIVTPTLKAASNEKERAHLFELMAQRISGFVEPHYVSDDMLRGQSDEVDALILYAKHCAPVQNIGFMTNSKWGFTIGYSPDALVGDAGLCECKSRRQKFQIETICVNVWDDAQTTIPADFVIQVQTGLLVSEREWIDFISYSGGMPLVVIRQYPDEKVQAAILEAAAGFEDRLSRRLQDYRAAVADPRARMIPTERKIYEDITL
jgi:hypothetical protein